jgi:hypothetical protein
MSPGRATLGATMKHSNKIPGIAAHVYNLGIREFSTPALETSLAKWESLNAQPLKGVNQFPPTKRGTVYVVRATVGKLQFTVSVLRPGSGHIGDKRFHAARLADITKAVFWKYRRRTRGMTDEDLNLSLAQVELDLKHESRIVELLHQIAELLMEHKYIPTLAEVEAARNSARPQLGSVSLRLQVARMNAQLETISKKLDTLIALQ